jgi:hypothetical protein
VEDTRQDAQKVRPAIRRKAEVEVKVKQSLESIFLAST